MFLFANIAAFASFHTYLLLSLLQLLSFAVIGGLELALGFLVGFETLAELTGKGERLEPLRAKLVPRMRSMGFLSLFMSAYTLAAAILL